jgi:hypothetical protein
VSDCVLVAIGVLKGIIAHCRDRASHDLSEIVHASVVGTIRRRGWVASLGPRGTHPLPQMVLTTAGLMHCQRQRRSRDTPGRHH